VATEDRHARKQAEAGEAIYQVIAESIPQQLWTSAPDGALDYVSPVRSIQYAIERTRAEETTRQLVREQAQHAIASAERARLHALFLQVPTALSGRCQ